MDGVPVAERTIFATFSTAMVALFYAVALLAVALFLFGVWRRIAKYRKGAKVTLDGRPLQRLATVVGRLASHSRLLKRNRAVGLAHGAIVLGFVVLLAGTAAITVDQDILRPISDTLRFWRGAFYRGFSLGLDLAGLALIGGLSFMALRRWAARPPRLDYRRPDRAPGSYDRRAYIVDDAAFLLGLIAIGLTGFLTEAIRIAISRPTFETWSVVGWSLADILERLGMTPEAAASLHPYAWWGHAILALAFIAYLPYAKSAHTLVGLVSLYARDPEAGRRLPAVAPESVPGYGSIADFSWAELVQLDACTKCGRCHAACPAHAGGWPLSPRDVILELRETAESTLGRSAWFAEKSIATPGNPGVTPATLWSCTTCLACVETCPVEIQHVPMIVQMRRRLVEEGNFESSIQTTLERVAQFGNSFGEPTAARGNWAAELDFTIKDARREAVDCLWFVGDFASFDPRVRRITLSAARVFQAAGLDFGILHQAERNAGNDIRRVGEEGLYTHLVEQNLTALKDARFNRIITTDPHSYNTLTREYPGLAGKVTHHTEILLELIESGRLAIKRSERRRATYHDPCHLSRYNGVTEPPRAVLAKLGVELVEMERHRANSFCCGAGGGRIWMASRGTAPRPSEQRLAEARRLAGVDLFVTACPKCFVMQTEAANAAKDAERLPVLDIVQLVEERLAPA